MADYEDAESPIGEERAPRRVRDRVGGPIGKAWAWFNGQPAQTKILVVGVIVVLGVVAWMALRKKPADTSQDDSQVSPGRFRPLGASRFGPGSQAANPTALPPTSSGSTDTANAPIVAPSVSGRDATSGPAPTATATTAPTSSPTTPTPMPAAISPPATFPVTPLGSTPTMQRTDVSLSGTITPLDNPTQSPSPTPVPVAKATTIVPISLARVGPTSATTRPTVISAVPTQRGTNVSF